MRATIHLLLVIVTVLTFQSQQANGQSDANKVLAEKAFEVFKQHCLRCHGQSFKVEGLNVRDHGSLTKALLNGRKQPYVVASKPEESTIWQRIADDEMPPESRPRLTDDEKNVIRQWIAAGAPEFSFVKNVRPFVSEESVQEAIRDHLRRVREEEGKTACKHQRYFSLTNIHNNRSVSDEELRTFKAALAKLINSLSWESEIVVPKAVDKHDTVFAIDMRDIDWTEQKHWNALLQGVDSDNDGKKEEGYPFGLEFQEPARMVDLADDVRDLAGNAPHRLCVRADWFIAKASRPPLYHTLLELPEDDATLEKQLEVSPVEDWRNSDMQRGAVLQSGVSSQNRVLDRHRGLHGYYWKSYDFKLNAGTSNLSSHPLGPVFDNHPFEEQAFLHAGCEIIFSLPNGLQGFLLVDKAGKRINKGPTDIVSDSTQTSGTTEIVNGLSCISCHKNGMRRFQDVVRIGTSVSGNAKQKVAELFLSPKRMDARLKKDEDRFLTALLDAVGGFLEIKDIDKLREYSQEPIGEVARYYNRDLTLDVVAAELGEKDVDTLKMKIQLIPKLRDILGTLTGGGVIKRTSWESRQFKSNSDMQDASKVIDPRKVPVTF